MTFHIVFTFYIWFLIISFPPQAVAGDAPGTDVAHSIIKEKVAVGHERVEMVKYVDNSALYYEGWDTLPQALFWRSVIGLDSDSAIINIARIRKPVLTIETEQWGCQSEDEKDEYKANLCRYISIDEEEKLYVTSGKKHFFEYKKVIPIISRSVEVFEENGTDPWYAQAILVIESPGKTHARSYVGARGAFQLMPYVARKYGLTVNRDKDERTDLVKSAGAACRLLNEVCVPRTKELLDTLAISYNEHDLWFRFLVLHVYHAGFANVSCAVKDISPHPGGMSLIRDLWQVECRGFKNESQNYSQIAIASLLEFDEILNDHPDTVFMVAGDRLYQTTPVNKLKNSEMIVFYSDLLHLYGEDLISGVIPASYYLSKTKDIEDRYKEITAAESGIPENDYLNARLSAERTYALGHDLMRKHRYEDAVSILNYTLERSPDDPMVYDSIGRAYKYMGDEVRAEEYLTRADQLLDNETKNN
jgi:hypothetical protein